MSLASTSRSHLGDRLREHDIELVIVSYHSRRLIEGLLELLPDELPVILVDNARGQDGLPKLAAARRNCRWMDGGGVGFARAANAGARASTRRTIIFVNPDTRPSLDALLALADELEHDESLAATSATTMTPEGRIELGVGGWEPSLRRAFVYASGLHGRWPRAGLFARPVAGEEIALDWLTGACLAVPRETFLSLGGFDERFFLYSEDVSYGRRVREAGYRQRLRTDVLVPHQGAGSGATKGTMLQQRGASMMCYVALHHGPVTVNAMRVVLSAGMFGRWGVCQVSGRADAATGFAAYLRGLWRGAPDHSAS